MVDISSPLPGTVKFYQRHLILCTGVDDWPAQIESEGGMTGALCAAVEQDAARLSVETKISACDEPSRESGLDLLVFPDQIRYLGLTEDDLAALLDDHLIGGRPSPRLRHEPIPGEWVFVCTHGVRDERCGQCGPPLITRFRREITARGLSDAITVRSVSHIGGHAYAGNVLIYPAGDWYGYVSPDDVPRLIDDAILRHAVIADHWRGCINLTADQQRTFFDTIAPQP